MKKSEAIALFANQAGLARACEITDAAVSMWPEDLTKEMRDRVQAALYRRERSEVQDLPRKKKSKRDEAND